MSKAKTLTFSRKNEVRVTKIQFLSVQRSRPNFAILGYSRRAPVERHTYKARTGSVISLWMRRGYLKCCTTHYATERPLPRKTAENRDFIQSKYSPSEHSPPQNYHSTPSSEMSAHVPDCQTAQVISITQPIEPPPTINIVINALLIQFTSKSLSRLGKRNVDIISGPRTRVFGRRLIR